MARSVKPVTHQESSGLSGVHEADAEESVAYVTQRLAAKRVDANPRLPYPRSAWMQNDWVDHAEEPAWFVELMDALWPQILAEAGRVGLEH
jgi:hypothetical protein